jgi:hypothetical protein
MINEQEKIFTKENPFSNSKSLRKHFGFSFLISLFFFALGNLLPGLSALCFASNLVAGLFITSTLELFSMLLARNLNPTNRNRLFLVVIKRALLFGFIVDGFKVGS